MFGASEDEIARVRTPSIHELNAMIPRKVRLDPDGGYAAVAFMLIAMSIGVTWFGALAYHSLRESQNRDALNREGRPMIATVTKLVSGRHDVYARYAFHVGDGSYEAETRLEYQREPRWPDGRTKYVRAGDQLLVQYLPSDPTVNHPSGWVWWLPWDVIPHLFALLFPAAGIGILASMLRERKLARTGWITEGEVIACAPKGKRFRVDYKFYDEKKNQYDGANEYSDEYKTGAKIPVIYLRRNPKRNDTYPLSTFFTQDD